MQPAVFFSIVFAGLVSPALAQVPGIVPTVTVEMGDVGGKIFGKAPPAATTRQYFIAAEPVQWDYAPLGNDPVCGKTLPPPVQNHQLVSKLRYVQYTDATFTCRVFPTERLGILGPVLRGVVGEHLAVTFLNRTPQPLSMHPHGVNYDKDNEGAYYQPNPGLGSAIASGARFTYVWQLDAASGPQASEPSSKGWLYHSHATGDGEANQGLMGFIIVTDPKRARPDGTPNDVDREMASLFMIFDESGLNADVLEALEYANSPDAVKPLVRSWTEIQQMLEAGGRHTINGRIFGNLTGLDMNVGERVRWYVFALGSEDDFHTAHWHGARVMEEGRRRTDVVELLPASMKVADMVATNVGSWLYHCHVAEHMTEGMFTQYTIHEDKSVSREPGAAFFGLAQTHESMRIKRAEVISDSELQLAGTVTVFEAFSVFNQTVAVTVGDKTVHFQPDRTGMATVNGSTFKARNVTPFGMIYGGVLEFEVKLQGAKADAKSKLPVAMQLGTAKHEAAVVFAKAP